MDSRSACCPAQSCPVQQAGTQAVGDHVGSACTVQAWGGIPQALHSTPRGGTQVIHLF